jgi:hypothetical protein
MSHATPRWSILALLLPVGLFSSGCSSLPVCQADDFVCLAQHLSLVEVDEQTYDDIPVPFTDLPGTALESLLPKDASNPSLPKFTGGYSLAGEWPLAPDEEDILELKWVDPSGARVGPCVRPCPRNMKCVGNFKCTDQRRDGKTSGTTLFGIRYTAQPAQDSQAIDLQLVPIAAASSNALPLITNWVAQGSPAGSLPQVLVGPLAVVKQLIQKQKQKSPDRGGPSPDGGGPGLCSTPGQACTSGPKCISQRNCIVNVMSSGCECEGSVSGQCGRDGYPACNNVGGLCGDGQHTCCAGFQCTNGRCEGAGGRCPLQ